MANTISYPDLALEKFIGIDSIEEPTAFIRLLEMKISFSLLQLKMIFKPYMTMAGKPFSVPSYAVQLLSGSIH